MSGNTSPVARSPRTFLMRRSLKARSLVTGHQWSSDGFITLLSNFCNRCMTEDGERLLFDEARDLTGQSVCGATYPFRLRPRLRAAVDPRPPQCHQDSSSHRRVRCRGHRPAVLAQPQDPASWHWGRLDFPYVSSPFSLKHASLRSALGVDRETFLPLVEWRPYSARKIGRA